MYDETSTLSYEYPVWSSLQKSNYLFHVTAEEYTAPYSPIPGAVFEKSNLVKCKIISSEGDNTTSTFPMKTKITLGYYQ